MMMSWPCGVVMMIVVIRFDGSLRVPSMDGVSRMATAAATIDYTDYDGKSTTNPRSSSILLVGGKHLDTDIYKTSGEAEFGGLILGLEGILAHQEHYAHLVGTDGVIKVQGDCKTAIQQMQGRSRSRKLGHFREEACQLLQRIPFHLEFEHIPREQNGLCDGICSKLFIATQEMAVASVNDSLLELLQPNGKERPLREIFDRYLLPPTILPGRARFKAYSIFGRVAWLQSDYTLLYEIGRQMEELSDVLAKYAPRDIKSNDAIMVRYKLEGIQYEIRSLRANGKELEAAKVERRERTLRMRHSNDEEFSSILGRDGQVVTLSSLIPEVIQWTRDCKASIGLRMNELCLGYLDEESASSHKANGLHLVKGAVKQLTMQAGDFSSYKAVWIPVDSFDSF